MVRLYYSLALTCLWHIFYLNLSLIAPQKQLKKGSVYLLYIAYGTSTITTCNSNTVCRNSWWWHLHLVYWFCYCSWSSITVDHTSITANCICNTCRQHVKHHPPKGKNAWLERLKCYVGTILLLKSFNFSGSRSDQHHLRPSLACLTLTHLPIATNNVFFIRVYTRHGASAFCRSVRGIGVLSIFI